MMKYDKKPIDTAEQVHRLERRGLLIKDKKLAEEYLNNISYYRLRAYTYPFQNNEEGSDHEFLRADISFQDIIDLYCFDRRLRALLFNAIEKIEVALRTRIALTYSTDKADGFWFLNDELYFSRDGFEYLVGYNDIDGSFSGDLMKEVNRSNEDFIAHYQEKYGDPPFPPAWMTLEVVSMGTLSRLFSALDKNNPSSKTIAKGLGISKVEILKNWMHGLSSLRNTCAHHSRIWNRRFTIGLKFPKSTIYPFLNQSEISQIRDNKLFGYLSIILYLLQIISPGSSFKENLLSLLGSRPKLASLRDMGFPSNWETFSLWK